MATLAQDRKEWLAGRESNTRAQEAIEWMVSRFLLMGLLLSLAGILVACQQGGHLFRCSASPWLRHAVGASSGTRIRVVSQRHLRRSGVNAREQPQAEAPGTPHAVTIPAR
jgi:hypothetical protein